MRDLFYVVVKKNKHGLINGNRALVYDRFWEGLEIIPATDSKKQLTFFKYTIDGKHGIGSIQQALHLPAQYADVEVQIVNDSIRRSQTKWLVTEQVKFVLLVLKKFCNQTF